MNQAPTNKGKKGGQKLFPSVKCHCERSVAITPVKKSCLSTFSCLHFYYKRIESVMRFNLKYNLM